MLDKVISSHFFSLTTNFSNKDDTLALGITQEDLKAVNEVSPVEWITSNPNAESLAQARLQNQCLIITVSSTKRFEL